MESILVGDTRLIFSENGMAALHWDGNCREVAFCAFLDKGHKQSVGESKTIKRSGKALNQTVNLKKIVGKDALPETYYFVATAEGFESNPATFEWKKPEVVTNAPAAPTESSVPDSTPPKVEASKVEATPPTLVVNTPDPNDTDLILVAVSNRLDVIEAAQRLWNEKLQRKTFKSKDIPAIPTWIAEMEAALTEIKLILLGQFDPKFNQAQTRADECSMWLVEFKGKVGQLQASTKPAPVPTPAPVAPPIPTPAPSPEPGLLSGKVEGLETRLEGLEVEVSNVKKQVTKVDGKVDNLGTSLEESLNTVLGEVKEAIEGLKNSSLPATPPPPPAAPPSGGSGSGTGGTGVGQTSATPKPNKNWLMILIGILATLLFFIGVGGWVVIPSPTNSFF